MTEIPLTQAPARRRLWVRALLAVLMCAAFQLAAWLLLSVAVLQLLMTAATGDPNGRLRYFGGALGAYLSQIADFVSFRTEKLPFPFADWPEPDERSPS